MTRDGGRAAGLTVHSCTIPSTAELPFNPPAVAIFPPAPPPPDEATDVDADDADDADDKDEAV